jgi:hypothetical protein
MDKLKLGKTEYPFLFAIKAQREMGKENLTEKDDIYFIWLGLKYGAIKDGRTFDLTEDDLVDLFEDDLEAYEHGCKLLGEHLGKLKKMKGVAMQALQ